LASYTIVGTIYVNVGIVDGATLPLITFCALASTLSYSHLIFDPKVPPSSTLFFLLRALLGDYAATFFLFSSVIYISSLVLFTLVNGFCGFFFW